MAARIFRRQTKKNRTKIMPTTPRNGAGIDRMIHTWKRYQKTPVTWKEPRIRQDHPRSGAWGGLASAGAATGAVRDPATGGFYSDTPSISTSRSVRQRSAFR